MHKLQRLSERQLWNRLAPTVVCLIQKELSSRVSVWFSVNRKCWSKLSPPPHECQRDRNQLSSHIKLGGSFSSSTNFCSCGTSQGKSPLAPRHFPLHKTQALPAATPAPQILPACTWVSQLTEPLPALQDSLLPCTWPAKQLTAAWRLEGPSGQTTWPMGHSLSCALRLKAQLSAGRQTSAQGHEYHITEP